MNDLFNISIPYIQIASVSTISVFTTLTLFNWALFDDHTPRATSPAAFCHNLANLYLNSNFDIAKAEDPSAQAPAMSNFKFE